MDNKYTITTDALEILSGTNNRTSPIYLEAVNNAENDQKKATAYMKRFLRSIHKVSPSGKLKNDAISKTKGNISSFFKYDDINQVLDILGKHIPNNIELKSLNRIKDKLESNKSHYMDAYSNKLLLLIMEYETSMYMLIEGLGFVLVSYVTITFDNGIMKIVPKKGSINKSIISKLIIDLSKELSNPNHDDYIKEIVSNKSSDVMNEAVGDATLEAIKLITNIIKQSFDIFKRGRNVVRVFMKSIFGILPIIRSIIYLHYKRKADKIKSLELNAHFIQLNIEMLENKTNMNPEKKAEIISKQQAKVIAYLKAAEKLRAELVEAEKDTADALNADNKTMNQPTDDDFILD